MRFKVLENNNNGTLTIECTSAKPTAQDSVAGYHGDDPAEAAKVQARIDAHLAKLRAEHDAQIAAVSALRPGADVDLSIVPKPVSAVPAPKKDAPAKK